MPGSASQAGASSNWPRFAALRSAEVVVLTPLCHRVRSKEGKLRNLANRRKNPQKTFSCQCLSSLMGHLARRGPPFAIALIRGVFLTTASNVHPEVDFHGTTI
jgi:hypothetical protein